MRVPKILATVTRVSKAALLAALGITAKMPPGFLNPFERGMFRDQLFILKRAVLYGPIFKVFWSKQLMICIVSNEIGRRFLKIHQEDLQGVSIDLSRLFQPGIIRNMEGQSHHNCKQHLVRIFNSEIIENHESELSHFIASQLQAFSSGQDLKAMLRQVVTGCMITLFFGTGRMSESFDKLVANYEKFGPTDLVWKLGIEQTEAFEELRVQAALLASTSGGSSADEKGRGYLQEAFKLGYMTEAVLGNLIYAVEMGRHDVAGLLRWVLKYLGENQNIIKDIRRELDKGNEGSAKSLIKTVVFETLRLDQSAALIRKTTNEIIFDGLRIPAHSYIRICLWEAHKDADHFADPFEFRPSRFLNGLHGPDMFAPFGLDIHRCLGPDIIMGIASAFIAELIANYDLKTIADGPPVLTQTIWEVSPQFSIKLSGRNAID